MGVCIHESARRQEEPREQKSSEEEIEGGTKVTNQNSQKYNMYTFIIHTRADFKNARQESALGTRIEQHPKEQMGEWRKARKSGIPKIKQ